jgi:hypothetical protein
MVQQSFSKVKLPVDRHRLALRLAKATQANDRNERHAVWFEQYPAARRSEQERTLKMRLKSGEEGWVE